MLFAPAHHAHLFDINDLERDLEEAEPIFDVESAPRGSMSMCNSRSAETFRKSGTYAAKARASVKRNNMRKEESEETIYRVPRESSVAVPPGKERRLVVTRRAAVKGQNFRMDTTAQKRESEKSGHLSSGVGIGRRISEARRTPRKEVLSESIIFTNRRESIRMRERDENDFRVSNAKLPEREDADSARTRDWGKYRRRRSAPILGRYTRSRSSKLPSSKG